MQNLQSNVGTYHAKFAGTWVGTMQNLQGMDLLFV